MDGEAHILANRRKAGGSPVRSRSLPRPTLAKTPKAQRRTEDRGRRTASILTMQNKANFQRGKMNAKFRLVKELGGNHR